MNWILILVTIMLLVGAAEKSDHRAAVRVRGSRAYQGGKRHLIDLGNTVRGRPPVWVNGQRATINDLPTRTATAAPKAKRPATVLGYTTPTTPPSAAAATPSAGGGQSNGIPVDFFQGLLMLVNAPYEGPKDALRQLRVLGEGGRTWDNGLIRLHQRMSDPGDMRIDPFVSDHVVRAAAFGQAMVLELVEADAAMTALLNMTLAEITERGLRVPNTR